MSNSVIELVQLKNGDIVLRNSDDPDQPIVTISFSNEIQSMMPNDKMEISQAMVEAGIERFQEIQFDRAQEIYSINESDVLH